MPNVGESRFSSTSCLAVPPTETATSSHSNHHHLVHSSVAFYSDLTTGSTTKLTSTPSVEEDDDLQHHQQHHHHLLHDDNNNNKHNIYSLNKGCFDHHIITDSHDDTSSLNDKQLFARLLDNSTSLACEEYERVKQLLATEEMPDAAKSLANSGELTLFFLSSLCLS